MKSADKLLNTVGEFAASLREQRTGRQQRTHLDRADFDNLLTIGFHLAAIPEAYGGFWQGVSKSVRPICEALRTIATGDPSLALSLSMHPAVLAFWRDGANPDPPDAGWEQQKQEIYATVVNDGAWWATVRRNPEVEAISAKRLPPQSGVQVTNSPTGSTARSISAPDHRSPHT